MKQLEAKCIGVFNSTEPTDSFFELIIEALDDYKLSKKGGSKCQHMINPDTIG